MQTNTVSRKRNVDLTRHDIMEAAKLVFTTKGYDQASTRDIAKLAGINVSLVIRYFGSKRNLFELTVVDTLRNAIAGIDLNVDLPEYLTELLLNKSAMPEFDPIIAMLRSASSEEVAAITGYSVEELRDAPRELVAYALEHLDKMPETKRFLRKFELQGKKYGFIPDWEEFTAGEYIDLESYLSDFWANAEKVLAILYREIDYDGKKTSPASLFMPWTLG